MGYYGNQPSVGEHNDSFFIIEKTQKIQGQEKRLFYRGDMTWTTKPS